MNFRKNYDRTERMILSAMVLASIILGMLLMLLLRSCSIDGVIQTLNLGESYGSASGGASTDTAVSNTVPPLKFGDDNGYKPMQTPDSIEISAVAGFIFKAGAKEQQVEFINYHENPCVFRVAVYLNDGTEILRTGDILPGETVTSVPLEVELQAGIYQNALMVYEIYAINGDGTMQNRCEFPIEIKCYE